MSSLSIDHVSDANVAGALGNVHVAVYRGPLTTNGLLSVHRAHQILLEHHRKTCVLSLAEPNLPLPGADVRKLATKLGQELAPRILCSSQVISGEGFWASAARSMLTAMLWIQNGEYPMNVSRTVEEACRWVSQHNLASGPSYESLVESLERMRTTPA